MADVTEPVVASRPIRLVLADDHPVVLAGLDVLFSLEPDFEILARAKNGDEALRFVRQLRPDILLLDLRMPGTDGLTVLREMSREKSPTRAIVLTAVDGDDVLEAIHLGVHGLVLKDMAPKLVVRCIREVHAGRKWLDRNSATHAVDKLLMRETSRKACLEKLTPRELEIACMIAKGMHNKAVADKLSITEGTAKLHLHHVYQKLNVDGRMGLMRHLRSRGLD
jgi:two-component system, NarL family, nitrate/nitrite response regulator NarL